ncbi:methyltransferase domain-containing protein [Candidatus Woesearchaeota archaeon]|nr:methyltransferase domain-containing protein [Candidatus Woesearchaeota archaeon]
MFLLIPGRHIVNTRFQEEYLKRVLGMPVGSLEFLDGKPSLPPGATLDTIIFAITSSNLDNSRFNPVSFVHRAISVDRFGSQFNGLGVSHRIFGIPDYVTTNRFSALTLKEILEQSEGELALSPENTVVMCSTPPVISMYRQLGYSILPGELASLEPERYAAMRPIDVVRKIAGAGEAWSTSPDVLGDLSFSTLSFFRAHPEVPRKMILLFNDPMLTEEGSLTDTRDYGSYVVGMGNIAIVRVKYDDIRRAIMPGKIVDHGCADGALIELMAKEFPDSDFYGVDASANMIERAKQRQTLKAYGNDTFVFFRQGNIISPLFKSPAADTITCLSLLHEVWSYGAQKKSIDDYLASVRNQLVTGGRFVVRDVVGPEHGEQEVYLWCNPADGSNENPYAAFSDQEQLKAHLDGLSTYSRFMRFASDFLAEMRQKGKRGPETEINYRVERIDGKDYFVLRLKEAVEFMLTKDYTDNWRSEMNEEFTYRSFGGHKRALEQAGFRVIENPNDPMSGSRAYTSPWIAEHSFMGKAELYEMGIDRNLHKMAYPMTNMVLVGEKA